MTEAPAAATAAAPPAEPAEEAKPSTTYLVLSQNPDGHWSAEEEIDARSSKAAIADFVKANSLDAGTFAAVPARSWTPITVKTETTTKLSFGS